MSKPHGKAKVQQFIDEVVGILECARKDGIITSFSVHEHKDNIYMYADCGGSVARISLPNRVVRTATDVESCASCEASNLLEYFIPLEEDDDE